MFQSNEIRKLFILFVRKLFMQLRMLRKIVAQAILNNRYTTGEDKKKDTKFQRESERERESGKRLYQLRASPESLLGQSQYRSLNYIAVVELNCISIELIRKFNGFRKFSAF